MLNRMRGHLKPSHLAVVWDGGLSADRVKLVPEYKSQRPPMPDDLASQIEEIVGYLAVAGVCSLQQDDVEADDLIASLARRGVESGADVVIASSDKDFFQLVSSRIGLLNPSDKTETVWSADQVIGKTGVEPRQIVDWLSLVGDAVDNIRGVPGIGPKTAAQLLRQFGTVEELFTRIDEVRPERLQRLLSENEAVVLKNRRMVKLDETLPVASMDAFGIKGPDVHRMKGLLGGWGFQSLAAELPIQSMRQAEML